MQVFCPSCQTPQEYTRARSNAGRYRKLCIGCGRKFEIKLTPLAAVPAPPAVNLAVSKVLEDQKLTASGPPAGPKGPPPARKATPGGGGVVQVTTAVNQSPVNSRSSRSSSLVIDDKNKALMEHLDKCLSQKEVAGILGISPAAVTKRVKKLVTAGIIVQFNTRPRSYKINPVFKQTGIAPGAFPQGKQGMGQGQPATGPTGAKPASTGNKVVLTNHLYPVRCDVIGNYAEYDALCKKSDVMQELQNWSKKYFLENDMKVQLTTKSITFHVTGVGYSIPEMFSNAKNKAVDIYRNLEKKFNLKLMFPEFVVERGKVKSHINVFSPVSAEAVNQLHDDQSHEGKLETDDPNLAGALAKTINEGMQNAAKFAELDAAMKNLADSQSRLNDVAVQLANGQASINNTLAMLVQGQQAIQQMLEGMVRRPGAPGSGPAPDGGIYQ